MVNLLKTQSDLQILSEKIKKEPNNPELYYERSLLKREDKDRLEDINRAIQLDPTKSRYYISRARINTDVKRYNDIKKAYELDPKNKYIAALLNYIEALIEYHKKNKDGYEKYMEKSLELVPDYPPLNYYFAKKFYEEEKYEKALGEINKLENSSCPDLYIFKGINYDDIIELRILINMQLGNYYECYDEIYENLEFNADLISYFKDLYEVLVDNLELKIILDLFYNNDFGIIEDSLLDDLSSLYHKAKEEGRELKKEEIKKIEYESKINERNRILSNISHTIKNMISTIIDPLENLKTSNELKPAIIDNAIRGANLIRNLVNAMNLSFQGSVEDFKYDVKHANYHESSSLEELITKSLKYSVSCMFDGKYFERFMRNYFPTKAVFITAKNKWNDVSQSFDLIRVQEFINEYMLNLKLNIESTSKLVIGNEKGSSLKLLILFQEIILNAIKYSSFVLKDERELSIELINNNENIKFIVFNKFGHDIDVKSSGLGIEIIKNFTKLLKTKPIVKHQKNFYIVEIIFKDFWSEGK